MGEFPIDRTPLCDQVSDWLRHQIVTFQPGFRPGERLRNREIADRLRVSVTPVSAAMRRLASEHLVVIEPRKGTYVWRPAPEEIRDLFEFVGWLEAVSLQIVEGRVPDDVLQEMAHLVDRAKECSQSGRFEAYLAADRAFHCSLGCLAHNDSLQQVYMTKTNQFYLVSAYKALSARDRETALQQHGAIVDVLREGSLRRSVDCVTEHWRDSYRRYMDIPSSVMGIVSTE